MADSVIGFCEIEFDLPGVTTIKEKRGLIKSMLTRLRKTYNIATAEVSDQNVLNVSIVALTTVSNSSAHVHGRFQKAIKWIERHFPDAVIADYSIELL